MRGRSIGNQTSRKSAGCTSSGRLEPIVWLGRVLQEPVLGLERWKIYNGRFRIHDPLSPIGLPTRRWRLGLLLRIGRTTPRRLAGRALPRAATGLLHVGMLHHRPAKLPLGMAKVRPATTTCLKVGGLVTITGLLPTSKGEDLDVAPVMEVMCRTTSLGLMKFLLIRISRLLHMGSTR